MKVFRNRCVTVIFYTCAFMTNIQKLDGIGFLAFPEQQTVANDRIQLIKRLMDRLPEKQRTCMQLRDIEGKAYKEIAAALDISEQQVKVNIFRARQTIRQQYLATEQYGL